jgi:ribosome biogenesis GTPase
MAACACTSAVAERPRGRVLALQANFCLVGLDDPGPGEESRLLCTRRTRLGKSGQQICVGDRVRLEGIDWAAGRAAVAAVEARTSLLARPAVANVSRVVVVVSLREPVLDPLQLTRFLLTAEATGQAVDLVLSKADLAPPAELADWCGRVRAWGYPVHPVSVRSGQGLEGLRAALDAPDLVVVCGPSGVGKSSLLNALRPELGLRTGAVSGRLQRGRHTTRHVELFALGQALVADSPGFNRPELPDDGTDLAALFPELRRSLAETPCRFRNCRHLGDPGCALQAGWDRQALYGQCLADLETRQQERGAGRPAGGEAGARQHGDRLVPRLDPRLRRGSRRTGRQRLEEESEGDLSPQAPAG